jgi:peptidoglycan/xylan/chitin deacetylase (PgdA/CDA1 family)
MSVQGLDSLAHGKRKTMNNLAEKAAYALFKYSGALSAQEKMASLAGRRHTSILLFHRVTDTIPEDGLTVRTRWFREFCALMRDTFQVLSLAELHRLLQTKQTPAARTVAITFDDCYGDNLAAARVLAEHQLTATFFVPSAYVNTNRRFAWDAHLPPMSNLRWDDLKEMVQLGHDIGSHTVSHSDLAQARQETVYRELRDSKQALESQLQRRVRWLAYPFGGPANFRHEYLPLVYEVGYDACFSGHGGFVYSRMFGDVLPRIPAPYFRSLLKLELYLRGGLSWWHNLKGGAGRTRG